MVFKFTLTILGFKVLLLERERVFKFGQMAHSLRVGEKITRLMANVV